MPLPIKILLSLLASYLLGSIPTAYLAGRLVKGIDIRKYGSGNVGATNAIRVLGKVPGIIVLVVDALKGILAAGFVPHVLGLEEIIWPVTCGLVAVAGHNWTVFLQFKGGKGMATSLGVLLGLMIRIAGLRLVVGISVLSWLLVFLASGFVSLASIVAAVVLPIAMVIFSQPFELVTLSVILCGFVILRHRPNIRRLVSGQEHRFNRFFSKKS